MKTFLEEFCCNAMLPRSFTSYLVPLIPKVNSMLFYLGGYYRLISLLGCLYKIVVKVLTAKLSTVMDNLISPIQSALFKGRNLVDGIFVANVDIHFAKSRKKLPYFKGGF